MKCTEIEIKTALKKQSLDPNQYTLSLIREGYRAGLIDQQSLNNIQSQLMSLLKDSIMKYTKGESTSVKVETAQSILLSVLYSIDAYLSNFNDPKDAISLLSGESIIELYEKGLTLVYSCLKETILLYSQIKGKKLNIPLKAYQSTIDEALPGFFKSYDVIFKAHETMASIDYPLLFDDTRIKGIFYIKQYLKKLDMETQFCRLFPEKDIEKVLLGYGNLYHLDYKEALINMFEVSLTNSIFSVLSSNSAKYLSISEYQYEVLHEKLDTLDHNQFSSLISKVIEALLDELCINQLELRDYIRNFKSILMPRFLNALDHDCLQNVIIVNSKENQQLDIIFREGNRIDDNSFRDLVAQILACSNIIEKQELINSSIHSIEDFIDILEADCLFGDEFMAIFNILGNMELSILAKIVLNEELRSDSLVLSLQNFLQGPIDIQWKAEYAKFLSTLNINRLKTIEEYIHLPFQPKGCTWS